MLVLFRFIFSLFNKERVILSNYNRSHPHFIRYLGLDALLSVALVFSGFSYAFSPESASSALLLERSGAIALSPSELIKTVKDDHSVAYWLGPLSGYKYTLITTRKDEVIVSYFPPGSDITRANEVRMTVTTYTDPSKVKSPVCSRGDAVTGNTGEACENPTTFNRDTMKEETVLLRGTDTSVVINYTSAQSISTMVKNGSSLKRIG